MDGQGFVESGIWIGQRTAIALLEFYARLGDLSCLVSSPDICSSRPIWAGLHLDRRNLWNWTSTLQIPMCEHTSRNHEYQLVRLEVNPTHRKNTGLASAMHIQRQRRRRVVGIGSPGEITLAINFF